MVYTADEKWITLEEQHARANDIAPLKDEPIEEPEMTLDWKLAETPDEDSGEPSPQIGPRSRKDSSGTRYAAS